MQATSRESLHLLRAQFDEQADGASVAALRTLGDELAGVTGVLADNRELGRHLVDQAVPQQSRTGLVDGLFGGKVSDRTATVLRDAVGQRWSRARDLLDTLELLARQALLAAAEQDGVLDDTEDELFRFGRVLGNENRLRELLGDPAVPAARRVELLHSVLDGKAGAATLGLLEQAVRTNRGRGLDQVVEQLAELAAARRQRSVATVTAAAPLSETQETRLAELLTRIYRRAISVQVVIDPELLGGLVVRVGDEVIDGSIASRLAKAGQGLPS